MKTTQSSTRRLLAASTLTAVIGAVASQAATVAYWRFEGTPNTVVDTGATAGFAGYSSDIPDASGNGNALAVWDNGGAGFTYRADVASATVPGTGLSNTTSVQNTGGFPAMWNQSLRTWNPTAFTIEFYFKPEETNGFRTFVGRDSQGGSLVGDQNTAALYLGLTPTEQLKFSFLGNDGTFNEAISAEGTVPTWNPTTGSAADIAWQHVAATSDGTTMRLYLNGLEVAATVLGTGDNAFSTGTGSAGDWTAGDITVGRGLYAGGHTDRAFGLLDEVRLSDTALTTSQFLNAVPEPSTLLLGSMGALALLRRRR